MFWVIFAVCIGTGVRSGKVENWDGENVTSIDMGLDEVDFFIQEGDTVNIPCPESRHVIISYDNIILVMLKKIGSELHRFENGTDFFDIVHIDSSGPEIKVTMRPHKSGTAACRDLNSLEIVTERNIYIQDTIRLEVFMKLNDTRERIQTGDSCILKNFKNVEIEIRTISIRNQGHECWIAARQNGECPLSSIPYFPESKPGNEEVFQFSLDNYADSRLLVIEVSCSALYGNTVANSFTLTAAERLVIFSHDFSGDHPPHTEKNVGKLTEKRVSVKKGEPDSWDKTDIITISTLTCTAALLLIGVMHLFITCRHKRGISRIQITLENQKEKGTLV